MNEKLKPCPFCGGEAKLVRANDDGEQSYVYCKSCGAHGKKVNLLMKYWTERLPEPHSNVYVKHEHDDSTTEAIEAWNRRGNDERTD